MGNTKGEYSHGGFAEERDNVTPFEVLTNNPHFEYHCTNVSNYMGLSADDFEYTRYSSCCNMDMGIYYYTTYDELEIKAINMNDVELNQSCLYAYGVKGS